MMEKSLLAMPGNRRGSSSDKLECSEGAEATLWLLRPLRSLGMTIRRSGIDLPPPSSRPPRPPSRELSSGPCDFQIPSRGPRGRHPSAGPDAPPRRERYLAWTPSTRWPRRSGAAGSRRAAHRHRGGDGRRLGGAARGARRCARPRRRWRSHPGHRGEPSVGARPDGAAGRRARRRGRGAGAGAPRRGAGDLGRGPRDVRADRRARRAARSRPAPRCCTICNAGALATGGIGTALAPMYRTGAGRGPQVVVAARRGRCSRAAGSPRGS